MFGIDDALLGSIITGGTALAGLLGGDKSKTTSSTKVTPATWNQVGYGSEDLWNEFMNYMNGGATTATFYDPISGETYQDTVPGSSPTVKDMMAEDYAAQRSAADKYLEDYGVISSDQTSGIQGETDKYRGKLDQIISDLKKPAFNFKFGGSSIPHTTKRQMLLADSLKDLNAADYNAAIDTINSIAASKGSQADRTLGVNTEYTPNKSTLDYFNNVLKPIVDNIQNLRFGHSSTSTTKTSEDSLIDRIASGVAAGSKLSDVVNEIFSKTGSDGGDASKITVDDLMNAYS